MSTAAGGDARGTIQHHRAGKNQLRPSPLFLAASLPLQGTRRRALALAVQ